MITQISESHERFTDFEYLDFSFKEFDEGKTYQISM